MTKSAHPQKISTLSTLLDAQTEGKYQEFPLKELQVSINYPVNTEDDVTGKQLHKRTQGRGRVYRWQCGLHRDQTSSQ